MCTARSARGKALARTCFKDRQSARRRALDEIQAFFERQEVLRLLVRVAHERHLALDLDRVSQRPGHAGASKFDLETRRSAQGRELPSWSRGTQEAEAGDSAFEGYAMQRVQLRSSFPRAAAAEGVSGPESSRRTSLRFA